MEKEVEEEVKEEVKEEVEEEEEVEEKEIKEDDEISSEDRNLIALLKDPTTSKILVKALAEEHGLLKEVNTKEVQKDEDTVLSDLKKALPEEWSFLADNLAPVLEKHIKTTETKVRSELSENESKRQKDQFSKAERVFFKSNPDAKSFRKRMASLASEYPPSQGKDPDEYFSDLFTLASGRSSSITDTITKKRNDRINKNKDNDNLSSKSSSGRKDKSGKMSIQDAVQKAFASLEKE